MGILDSLLGRWGYVRLNEFGLVRSPDGRIVMLHRRVLDDGQGGRIVGWRPEDPAPTVLEPMDLVPRTASRQVEAARASVARASQHVPAAVAAAIEARRPRAASEPGEPGEHDADEWEWQLAMARARAAADDAERAAAARMAAVEPAAKPVARPVATPAARIVNDLPSLVAVKSASEPASGPVLAVAKLTPARTPPPVPARPATPARPLAVVVPAPVVSRPPVVVPAPIAARASEPPVPIERARLARGSVAQSPRGNVAQSPRGSVAQSPRVMSPPRSLPARGPARVERIPAPPIAAEPRAAELRPLPLPPPEDTTRTRPAPPARPPVAARFDSEVTQTDARPALPRFSARFR